MFVAVVMVLALTIPLTGCRGETPSPVQFTVTFNTMGGNTIPHQTVTSGQTATAPNPNPTRDGYSFVNWFTQPSGGQVFNFATQIVANITIYARWEQNIVQHLVHFNTTGGSSVPSKLVNENGFATRPIAAPTRGNDLFVNWYTEENGGVPFVFHQMPITGLTTIFARWEAYNPANPFPIARAMPTQVPTSVVQVYDGGIYHNIDMPYILEYFTDGTNNFFLFDIGVLERTYLSTIFGKVNLPGGATSFAMSTTSTNSTAVTNASTQSGSNSLTTTSQFGASTTLSFGVQTGPSFAQVSMGVSVTASFSITQSQAATRSWSSSISEAVTTGTSDTFSVTIGPGAQAGYYRTALYGTSDIFVILKTNSDNTQVVSFEEVVVATGDFHPRVEFCPTGAFDNSAINPMYVANMDCALFLQALPMPEFGGFVYVSAGGQHSLAITENGQLWAWGLNSNGQLGDGTVTTRHTPTRIGNATHWASVSAGDSHSLAVTATGQVWAWGSNANGRTGLGISSGSTLTPTQIGIATNWASISAGGSHSLATTTNGELWAWGNNGSGRLGDGTTTARHAPARIGNSTTWISVSAGNNFSLALTVTEHLWAWGHNMNGQLGDGTTIARHTPTQIGNATWTSIATGNGHSIAVDTAGQLWAWGLNSNGQLGDGTTTSRSAPVQVGVSDNWANVSAGGLRSMAITTTGQLWAWGNNAAGQLGDGTTTHRYVPARIGTATNWIKVGAGSTHTLVITSTEHLWVWGSNLHGRLGDGTTTNRHSPVHITLP